MDIATVRHHTQTGRLVVSFQHQAMAHCKPRECHCEASLVDPVRVVLSKLTDRVTKLTKQKMGRGVGEEPVNVTLTDSSGETTSPSTPNEHAWLDGATLTVGFTRYRVAVNPPFVRSLKLGDFLLVGCPVLPRVQLDEADVKDSLFQWYRLVKGEQKTKIIQENISRLRRLKEESARKTAEPKAINGCRSNDDGNHDDTDVADLEEAVWIKLHEGHNYVPQATDVGHKLRVVCTPRMGSEKAGLPKAAMSKTEVVRGPASYPFEKRHELTRRTTTSESFRLVCYNILAERYGESEFARETLYPYCHPAYLRMEYRKHLILKEILGYNADIICLQEVEKKFFTEELELYLDMQGFKGAFKGKVGFNPEGCATFHRTAKFKLLGQHDLNISQSMTGDATYRELWQKVCVNEYLAELFRTRRSILQVSVLESAQVPSSGHQTVGLLVANTHFYYHPKAPHIRLLQCSVCLTHIKQIVDTYATKGRQLGVILCGDLNSLPETGVHRLLTQGCVPSNQADWYAGGSKEYAPNLELRQPLRLTSACGYPRYTNYVAGFSGSLDYIYLDKDILRPIRVVPLPSHQDIIQQTALPSKVFPSDHLAQVCDITWGHGAAVNSTVAASSTHSYLYLLSAWSVLVFVSGVLLAFILMI